VPHTLAAVATPWWKGAVVYQIYPRSFCDTDGDGVGDLEGVRRHLDHLSRLGVDAVWFSPFFRSPMADFGYDVSDYCDVDPLFGTLDDFRRLLDDAHERGIRVLLDWVPNHTSDRHPWFVESRTSRDNPKRDWYVWRDEPPNHWQASFGGDAWTYDAQTGQWYLHSFLPEQPDLDWRNPEVAAAMHETLRFWLDMGVDGFRIDVVHGLGKDPDMPDSAEEHRGLLPDFVTMDADEVHPLLRDLRRLADSYPGDRVLVGEVYILDTRRVGPYYGSGDELHLAFNFRPLHTRWNARAWRRQLEIAAEVFDPIDAWPVWVLSNHDNPRHRTRYGGSESRARVAAVLLLTLRGTAFLYAGEELGLEDAKVPKRRVVDPGGRDGCRAPIPWDASGTHGWGVTDAWLPWPPDPRHRNVERLAVDEHSILHLYRRLLVARAASDALRLGSLECVDAPDGVVAYERRSGADRRRVVLNFETSPAKLDLERGWVVDVATDGEGEGDAFSGLLAGDTGVVLRPV